MVFVVEMVTQFEATAGPTYTLVYRGAALQCVVEGLRPCHTHHFRGVAVDVSMLDRLDAHLNTLDEDTVLNTLLSVDRRVRCRQHAQRSCRAGTTGLPPANDATMLW